MVYCIVFSLIPFKTFLIFQHIGSTNFYFVLTLGVLFSQAKSVWRKNPTIAKMTFEDSTLNISYRDDDNTVTKYDEVTETWKTEL